MNKKDFKFFLFSVFKCYREKMKVHKKSHKMIKYADNKSEKKISCQLRKYLVQYLRK